jgi:hypothetical protein
VTGEGHIHRQMSNTDPKKEEPILLRVEDDGKVRLEIYYSTPTDEQRALYRRFMDSYVARIVQHMIAKNKKDETKTD